MPAGKLNLVIEQGATFIHRFTYYEADGSTPIDITGYDGRMQVRSDMSNAIVLIDLTVANGGVTITGASGIIDLLVSAAATAAFTWENGVYDVEIESPAGVVIRLVQGKVKVNPEVTR